MPGFAGCWTDDTREGWEKLKPWQETIGFQILDQRRKGEAVGCGCFSPEQLREWITHREYKRLQLIGYRAVEMEADRILGQDLYQCVFARSKPLHQNITPIELYD